MRIIRIKRIRRSDMAEDHKKQEAARALKFTLFSISAGVIQVLVTTVLLDGLLNVKPYWVCYLVGLVASVIWNFTLNRQYTFRSAGNVPVAMLKVAIFYAVFTPLSTLFIRYTTDTLGWNHLLMQVIVMLMNFVLEFLYDRFFVFGKTIDTNERAKRQKE
jgi:putative flippase GtrA